MGYDAARKCFHENVDLSTPPGRERTRMMEYNLNAGLKQLAMELSRDMATLHSQIETLRVEVQQLRTQR